MTKNKNINNFSDFSEFSDTEKKLAEIWKDVLLLSTEEYEELNKESDFFDLTPSWCVTFEINSLIGEIGRVFKISTDFLAVDDYSCLSEQAAMIDRAIVAASFKGEAVKAEVIAKECEHLTFRTDEEKKQFLP